MVDRRFGDADYQRMADLYKQGYSCTEIGEAAGASPTYVRQRIKRKGVKMRGINSYAATKEEKMKIAKLYKKGMTLKEVAKETGYSYSTVWNVLNRLGIPRRPVGNPYLGKY